MHNNNIMIANHSVCERDCIRLSVRVLEKEARPVKQNLVVLITNVKPTGLILACGYTAVLAL